jgi:aspartate/methionine/tyrosine aminotransferase
MRLGVMRRAAMQREVSRAAKAMLERSGAPHVKVPMNSIFAELGTSVFEVMSRLAREREAVNLGQGFPDDPGPRDVRAKAAEAVLDGWNQYPPMLGLPELRAAIAHHYRRFQGLALDPESEIMVTSGATEALAGALLALIEPGDEVVLFQPMYDAYLPLVRRAGGVAKFVTLKPPLWTFDEADLEAAFSPRTRVVLFNNPLNPTGVVYGREALEILARACVKHDVVALCDEVWEHVIFDERRHVPLIAMEGMRERSVKIGSAGKIFSLTGWKVGFVCASAPVLRVLAKAHQFITFTTPPNLQTAVAYGLMKDDAYFIEMRAAFQRSRDRFSDGLKARGFTVLESAGTYFLNIDIAALGRDDDVAFCRWLVEEHGVAAIPVSAFYAENPVRTVVRFCFAKRDATLDSALDRLSAVAARAS